MLSCLAAGELVDQLQVNLHCLAACVASSLLLSFHLLPLSLDVNRFLLAVALVRFYPILELCLVTEFASVLVVPIGDFYLSVYIKNATNYSDLLRIIAICYEL